MDAFDSLLSHLVEFPESAGKALETLRKARGFSQNELADICFLDLKELESLEGDFKEMTIEQAKRLSLALGVHPGLLLFPDGTFSMTETHKQIAVRANKSNP